MPSAENLAVGVKQVLFGPLGSGKTGSICTLLKYWDEVPITPVVLAHDPNAISTLRNVCEKLNVDFSKIIFYYFPESDSDWSAIHSYMDRVAHLDYDGISKMPYTDSKREMAAPYMNFLFKMMQERINGVPITNLDPLKYWVFHDGLSHITRMSVEMAVGAKPTLHQGEWNVAQKSLITLIKPFVAGRCNYTLISHEEREINEISGLQQITLSAVAKKNAAQVLSLGFGEVAHTSITEKGQFVWQFGARAPHCLTKTRFFNQLGAEVPADYGQYLKYLRDYINEQQQ